MRSRVWADTIRVGLWSGFWVGLVGGLALILAGLPPSPSSAQTPQTQCVSTASAGGTGDVLTIPLLPCGVTTTLLILKLTATNSVFNPTLQMLGGGTPQVIQFASGVAITAGALASGQTILLTNNGVNWLILSAVPGNTVTTFTAPANQFLTGYGGGGFTSGRPNCANLSDGGVFCSGTNAGNLTGTIPAGVLPSRSSLVNTHPANPTGTAATGGFKMMGLGSSCNMPAPITGVVQFVIEGLIGNTTASDGTQWILEIGQPTPAPANGSAQGGTDITSTSVYVNAAANPVAVPFHTSGIAFGLNPGLNVWFDLAAQALTGGTTIMQNLTCWAQTL